MVVGGGKWPINLERNVDQEFRGKDNTREKEEKMWREEKENRMIFLHTHTNQELSQRKRFRREYK